MRKILLATMFLTLLNCSEKNSPTYEKIEGTAFGTTFHITMKTTGSEVGERQIDSLIQKVNNSLSTYIPNSIVSRINRGDTTVVIDRYFAEVFHKSGRVYADSYGAFDPTIGILVNAWGFGPGEAIPDMDQQKVDSLMQSVGFSRLKLKQGKIIKPHPDTYLDFNANAKGYGVDVIGRFLESKGIKDYLVEIGGEIRARGKNEKGNPWTVAIEEPNFDGSRSFQAIIELNDESIATSGSYRKFKVDPETGQKYSHTIDTQTGYPSKSKILSASVIGSMDCADADGYATAFMAMGLPRTKVYLHNHRKVKAFLIYVDEEGQIKTLKTDNLEISQK